MTDPAPFELSCFTYPAWRPLIQPASARRDWMDASPDGFAYRCLPLQIANAHGWELINPHGFEAEWDGTQAPTGVSVVSDPGTPPEEAVVPLFGAGTITFNIPGLFRTPEGWSLWVGPSPNFHKDGIQALGGVVETDWSPFSFTMNWRFTRPHHRVRFERGEPIACFFPVERALFDRIKPVVRPITEAPDLKEKFERWAASRRHFFLSAADRADAAPTEKWQKHYYRGTDADGVPGTPDHRSKLRVPPFAGTVETCPVRHPYPEGEAARALATGDPAASVSEQEALFLALEAQRRLSDRAGSFFRLPVMPTQAFLDHVYAPARAVVLADALDNWPALRWTRSSLVSRLAGKLFYCREPSGQERSSLQEFVARSGPGRIVSSDSPANASALAKLQADLGTLPAYLSGAQGTADIVIARTGDLTSPRSLRYNRFIAQLVGRTQFILSPPAEIANLYPRSDGQSAVRDLTEPGPDFPLARQAHRTEVVLDPGELLFVPFGWWCQSRAVDLSVTAAFRNFRWPNG